MRPKSVTFTSPSTTEGPIGPEGGVVLASLRTVDKEGQPGQTCACTLEARAAGVQLFLRQTQTLGLSRRL